MKIPKWKRHYLKRRGKVLEYLGGQCTACQSTDNLEIDHVDPATKSFSIGEVITHSWAKIEPELKKCQLLCTSCHSKKSETDGSLQKMIHAFSTRPYTERERGEDGKFKKS
jgi:5-methylcytosine-specific restriction endonuclease McrA